MRDVAESDSGVWDQREAEKREQFEGDWPTLERILAEFDAMGIYLLDVSPANIMFRQ